MHHTRRRFSDPEAKGVPRVEIQRVWGLGSEYRVGFRSRGRVKRHLNPNSALAQQVLCCSENYLILRGIIV